MWRKLKTIESILQLTSLIGTGTYIENLLIQQESWTEYFDSNGTRRFNDYIFEDGLKPDKYTLRFFDDINNNYVKILMSQKLY